jgi:hypothetical protein
VLLDEWLRPGDGDAVSRLLSTVRRRRLLLLIVQLAVQLSVAAAQQSPAQTSQQPSSADSRSDSLLDGVQREEAAWWISPKVTHHPFQLNLAHLAAKQ